MADRFVVDAAVAALLPPEEAKRFGGDFVPESTNVPSARDELQRQCDDFNAIWPVGQRVRVTKDDGSNIMTTTRSQAQVLSDHTAVIWLVGISGCYLLDRVLPLTGRQR
ncbi:hypothetical protein [Sphingomonas paucimobilis]|uniref:hypothetical protein n=1 Tax=Sphingomonas paucimobilis TaxID=13689 RepID=UPI001E47216B|nr:hypothetical protein [Sphingomonas paucimobilis]